MASIRKVFDNAARRSNSIGILDSKNADRSPMLPTKFEISNVPEETITNFIAALISGGGNKTVQCRIYVFTQEDAQKRKIAYLVRGTTVQCHTCFRPPE